MRSATLATAYRLSTVALGLALLVVLLGAWTRINNAGLACPDWPTCYGQLVMPLQQSSADAHAHLAGADIEKAWLEMVHRYAAGTLGLLVLALGLLALRMRRLHQWPGKLSYVLCLLIVLQGAFGMWTVTLKLVPWVVTVHLLGGLLTLSLLYLLRIRLRALHPTISGRPMQFERRLLPLLCVLALQLVLGGWTSTNYAGASCTHWLVCHANGAVGNYDFAGGLNPVMPHGPDYEGGLLAPDARAAIQITHRFGALAVVVLLLISTIRLRHERLYRQGLFISWALCLTQIALGMLTVVNFVPVSLAFLHHLTAVLLWLSVLRFSVAPGTVQADREVCHVNKVIA
ncbi:COX15/CtaA family protein [Granulosicoccaceae sp. 1_MG-2023]|nr:COX15/CtaA family protein [Granulosicoccaceae sp. 1_MG-2023]